MFRSGWRTDAVFFCENRKTAKGPQSRGPSAHPSGFFFECLVVEGGSFVDLCLYSSILNALRYADIISFLHFLSDSLPARSLYSSILSALRYADIISFPHFLRDSLLARCLYASIFNALRCADIISFLHFLRDSLPARSLYSSILSALRAAISRFESQVRGGRLLVVTLAEPPSAR